MWRGGSQSCWSAAMREGGSGGSGPHSPWAANMHPAPNTKNHPTGYSWKAQRPPSGSTAASGLASALLKLTRQRSTNSRPPGYWAARTARRVKISIAGNPRTRILQHSWGNGLHETLRGMKTWNICCKEPLEHLSSESQITPQHRPDYTPSSKLELEEYLKIAFYNRNIFVIL